VALTPVLVATALTAIGLWLGAPALARFTAKGEALGYVGQLRILALFLPLSVLCDTLLAATRGFRAMRPTVLLDKLIRPLVQVLALAGLTLLAVTSPAAYTLAWVGPYLPAAVLAGYALARLLPKRAARGTPGQVGLGAPAARPNGPQTINARVFWRFTGPRAVASVAQLALQRVDVLLLASMAGLPAAACYAVAGRFLVLGQFANQAISLAVQPRLAELLSVGDRAGANTLYRTATGWLVLVAWPLYLGTAVFSSVYLGLFGPGYRGATGVVVVLSLGMLVATGCGMVDMVLSMAGRTSWNLANVVTALGVQLVMDLLLIPRLGALGAAIGLTTAIVTNNVVPLIQVGTALRLHPFGRSTLLAGLLAVLCFGLLPLSLVAAFGRRPSTAVLAVAVAGGCYLAACWVLRGPLRLDLLIALRRRSAGRAGAPASHTKGT
jgi:O-antigen/teichoic acid export membrane protein